MAKHDIANLPAPYADLINAALTWHQMPNGMTERALKLAAQAFLDAGERVQAPAPARRAAPAPAEAPPVYTLPTEPAAYEVYSDGSALRNPGPSGCGWVVVRDGKVVYEGFEAIGHGTNQVAEIRAAAHGLLDLPAGSTVDVHTDSLYVVQTMKGAFRKKTNLEHWQFLEDAVRRHATVRFHHVRGHAGHDMNERADVLANKGAARSREMMG